MGERTWRKLPDWPYEVSSDGRVRNAESHHELTPYEKRGYQRVRISRSGEQKAVSVHRLVLRAFVGPPPEGHEADHINGTRDDNSLENLRWLPSEDNRSIPGEEHGSARLTSDDVVEIREVYARNEQNQYELAEVYGVDQRTISLIVRGETWTHVGGPTSGSQNRRYKRGSNHPQSKFTDAEVAEIKRRLIDGDETTRELGEEYGVSRGAIDGIRRGRRYADVDPAPHRARQALQEDDDA